MDYQFNLPPDIELPDAGSVHQLAALAAELRWRNPKLSHLRALALAVQLMETPDDP